MYTVINDHCLDILQLVEDESVHCVVTSPPYWGLRDYGLEPVVWGGESGCGHEWGDQIVRGGPAGAQGTTSQRNGRSNVEWQKRQGDRLGCFCLHCSAWRGSLGLEPTPELYVEHMTAVFREVRRVLRGDGVVFLNLGDSYASSGGERSYGSYDGKTGRGPGARRYRASASNPQPPNVPACDSDDIELRGSSVPDSACSDLCDGCRDALQSGRNVHNDRQIEQSASHASQTGRDSGRLGSASMPPGGVVPGAQESTTSEFSRRPPGECSHCANCGACLRVLGSSSRDARLCARMAACSHDNVRHELASRNQDKGVSEMAYRYSTTASLKPKDLVMIPARVALALQADGWYLRSEIIWAKPNPMPESVRDRPTRSHEVIYLLSKSDRYYYDWEAVAEPLARPNEAKRKTPGKFGGADKHAEAGKQSRLHSGNEYKGTPTGTRNRRDVWTISTKPYKEAHFATFPPDLVEPCILAGCPPGGMVLDPFGGSGTVGQVAEALSRDSILIEANPAYVDLAEKRINAPLTKSKCKARKKSDA